MRRAARLTEIPRVSTAPLGMTGAGIRARDEKRTSHGRHDLFDGHFRDAHRLTVLPAAHFRLRGVPRVQEAWRARFVRLHDQVTIPERADAVRVGRGEDGHGLRPYCRGEMCKSG